MILPFAAGAGSAAAAASSAPTAAPAAAAGWPEASFAPASVPPTPPGPGGTSSASPFAASSPFVPNTGSTTDGDELVVSGGMRGLVPVIVGVIVLAAIALGSLVLSEDDSGGSVSASDRASSSDALVVADETTTTQRQGSTTLPTTATSPQTTAVVVAPTTPTTPAPSPTTTALRSVPAIPVTTIPFTVTPRVFVAPAISPTPTSPSTSPPVTTAARTWPGVSAVAYSSADGSFDVTLPGSPTVVSAGGNSGVTEYSVGLAGGVTLVVGRDNAPVDTSLPPDQLMPFLAQQIAASVGSTAWLGTPADLYGGRVLDSAVMFDGGVLRTRIAIVKGHRYWISLVVPAASVSSTQAMTAFQQALDSLVVHDAAVPTPPTTTVPETTTTEAPTTTVAAAP